MRSTLGCTAVAPLIGQTLAARNVGCEWKADIKQPSMGLRFGRFRVKPVKAPQEYGLRTQSMILSLALASLSSAVAANTRQHERPPSVIGSFASAPWTCAVLQAAYTAASRQAVLSYPKDVRTAARTLQPLKFVPEYRSRLALSPQEFDELAGREGRYDFPNFRPACTWEGNPVPPDNGEGRATFVTFTSPIFSNSGRLAIVEVSFRQEGWFGYGLVCVVRQRRGRWAAHCRDSWIT